MHKGITAGPTNLTIYVWALFWAPGALALYFQISLLPLHIHIFPTIRPFFSLPSSRFPLHLHPRLVVIFLPSKVQTGVTNLWLVAHTRRLFFTLPNLNQPTSPQFSNSTTPLRLYYLLQVGGVLATCCWISSSSPYHLYQSPRRYHVRFYTHAHFLNILGALFGAPGAFALYFRIPLLPLRIPIFFRRFDLIS